jgi:uncharacterized protein YfdQ (DUF2303 family)
MTDNVNETTAKLAREALKPALLELADGRQYLVHSNNQVAQDVTSEDGLKANKPRYVKQAIVVETADSLIAYANRFKGPESTLFAAISGSEIVVAIDYHGPWKADHVSHKASLKLPVTEEWKLWTGIDGKLMGQLDFARFIEENAADIQAPTAGDLLDCVRDLQAHRKVNFTKAVRTATNNENFEFTTESEARTRGGLELPTKFLLNIPVYFGEMAVSVPAFLRWNLDADSGSLKLGIALNRVEFIRQSEFKRIVGFIAAETVLHAVYGRMS